jgi:hypothetical protein
MTFGVPFSFIEATGFGMLNDEKVAAIIREHLEKKFPKNCSCCGRVYSTMEEYLRETTYVGEPVSMNASLGAGQPKARIGTLGFGNCPCGTTISVSSGGIAPAVMQEMASWAEVESTRRGITAGQLLTEIRSAIDNGILQKHDCADD